MKAILASFGSGSPRPLPSCPSPPFRGNHPNNSGRVEVTQHF